MDLHALEVLKAAKQWGWKPTKRNMDENGKISKAFDAVTLDLLYGLIEESQAFRTTVESTDDFEDTLLGRFWDVVSGCDPRLKESVETLKTTPYSEGQTLAILFAKVDRKDVDWTPVFMMAGEYFTHLAVPFLNPGGPPSKLGSPISVSKVISQATQALVEEVGEAGYGARKQEVLKQLAYRRDGDVCVVTGINLGGYSQPGGVKPILAHVIPNSIHDKVNALKCLAMFSGMKTVELISKNLDDHRNVMILESNAHTAYDDLYWGIEGIEMNGKRKYTYRNIRTSTPSPGLIKRRDGEEILFGSGKDGAELGTGPDPLLCNLQLAVARVLRMSGAADVVRQLKEDADDSDFPHIFVGSKFHCNMLSSKLLLVEGAQLF